MRYGLAWLLCVIPALACGEPIRFILNQPGNLKEYAFRPEDGSLELLAELRSEPHRYWPSEYWQMMGDERRVYARQRVMAPVGSGDPSWVEYSPDCSMALVQFFDRQWNASRPAEFGRTKPWQSLGLLPAEDSWRITDAAWSADGRWLVLLEEKTRASMHPFSVLRSLTVHSSDSYATLQAAVVDVQTGQVRRHRLGDELRNASGYVVGTNAACAPRRPRPGKPRCEVDKSAATPEEAMAAAKKCLAR